MNASFDKNTIRELLFKKRAKWLSVIPIYEEFIDSEIALMNANTEAWNKNSKFYRWLMSTFAPHANPDYPVVGHNNIYHQFRIDCNMRQIYNTEDEIEKIDNFLLFIDSTNSDCVVLDIEKDAWMLR